MSALYLLIGFSLLIATAFLALFLWAMRNDQYADTHTPAMRVLFDDSIPEKPDRAQLSSEEVPK